jgi:hypothetical protein
MVDLPTFGRPTIPQFRGMFRFFLNSYWNMEELHTESTPLARAAQHKLQAFCRLLTES